MNDPSWKKKINCVRVFTESTQVFHIKIRKLEYCLWTSNVVIFVFQWVFARKMKSCWKSSKWTLKLQITKKTHECNILIAWFCSYIFCELWANHTHFLFPAGINLFKVNNGYTGTMWNLFKVNKTPEGDQWRLSGVFMVKFEHISQIVLLLLLLSLNK